jgi:hypothetical protein
MKRETNRGTGKLKGQGPEKAVVMVPEDVLK